jgi:hypothetical protein
VGDIDDWHTRHFLQQLSFYGANHEILLADVGSKCDQSHKRFGAKPDF